MRSFFVFFFYKLCFVRVIIGSSGPGEKPIVCHLNICLSIPYLTFYGAFVNITVTVSNKSKYNFNNNENEVNCYIKTQSAYQKYGIICWSINTGYIYIYNIKEIFPSHKFLIRNCPQKDFLKLGISDLHIIS